MAGTLLDPRNGSDFDLSPDGRGQRAYIIASVPRSGSTLLARLLWDTGLVGAPKEYLNPMQLRDWTVRDGPAVTRWVHSRLRGSLVGAVVGRGWSEQQLKRHLERVQSRRSSGGWFGLKLHHHHLIRYGGLPFIDRMLPHAHWLRITREDRLGQAISWERALGSGQWAAWQPKGRTVPYRRERVRQRLADIEQAESGWNQMLKGRAVWQVSYESLVADPAATVRAALASLGVEAPVETPGLPTRRQADAVTAEWRARWAAGI